MEWSEAVKDDGDTSKAGAMAARTTATTRVPEGDSSERARPSTEPAAPIAADDGESAAAGAAAAGAAAEAGTAGAKATLPSRGDSDDGQTCAAGDMPSSRHEPGRSLRVSGLDSRMTAANCRKLLGKFGVVEELTHDKSGALAACTVTFAARAHASKCLDALNGKLVLGKPASVVWLSEHTLESVSDRLAASGSTGLLPTPPAAASRAPSSSSSSGPTSAAGQVAAARSSAAAAAAGGGAGGGGAAGYDLDRPLAALSDEFLSARPVQTQFDRVKNGKMFRGSGDGKRGGVWNGFGVTHTPQCPTLIVANVPGRGQSAEAVIKLFEPEEGYMTCRCIKHLVFVDFDSVGAATRAMVKHQNAVLPGHKDGKGLAIDYDKDSRAKRNREYEKGVQGERYQSRGTYERSKQHMQR